MPPLLIERGFKFFFYANDHEPHHIHVMKGGRHGRIDLQTLEFTASTLKVAERRVALNIATREAHSFSAAWDAFFAGR